MSSQQSVISERKILANRMNSQKSTGPKTVTGKQWARLNALRHGILTEKIDVLPDENLEHFRALVEKLKPLPWSQTSAASIDQVARLMWRSRRLTHLQCEVVAGHSTTSLATILRYEQSLGKKLRDSISELARVISAR